MGILGRTLLARWLSSIARVSCRTWQPRLCTPISAEVREIKSILSIVVRRLQLSVALIMLRCLFITFDCSTAVALQIVPTVCI